MLEKLCSNSKKTMMCLVYFISERCITGDGFSEQSSRLYTAYEAWCYSNGHQKKSSTAMAEDWNDLDSRSTNRMVVFDGVESSLPLAIKVDSIDS